MNEKMLNTYRNPRINSLIFKLTDFCNLGCSYCYRGSNKEKPKVVMDNKTIYNAINNFIKFKIDTGRSNEPIVLVWHGGEPLTAGVNKFKEILEIEDEFKKKFNVKFINSVQTNGTLITDEIASFFKENEFLVGFSLDGPKFIQDMNRYKKNKDSSFSETMRGINIIKNHNIYLNIIGVITNESHKFVDEIYSFIKEIGHCTVDFIPSFYYDSDVTLDIENYTSFMLKILDLWKNDDYKPIKIRFLNDAFKRVVFRSGEKKISVECELAGCCGQNFSVGINGEIYPCECLTPISDFEVGNINEHNFTELIKLEGFDKLKKEFNNIPKDCYECDIIDLCRGGCLNRRLEIHNLNDGKDLYCNSRKDILNKVIDIVNIEKKVPQYIYND
ncbi:radical SAM protein [Clostridium paraputrificum]|uniref:radical SAM protein n=1 Tax=Clostridium paraputrificum TaxID=29363 RepID=UPI003D331BA5